MKKSSSIFYLLSSIISGLSGFLLISILTKNFSPDDYGKYSLIITTVALATTVQIGWISQSILRFYEEFKNNKQENYVVSTAIFATLCMNLVLILIAFIYLIIIGFQVDISVYYFIFLTTLLFLPEGFYLVFGSILRAKNDSRLYSISVILYSTLKFLLTYIYIIKGAGDINKIIVSYIISGIVVCLLMYFMVIRNIKFNIKYLSLNIFSNFFKYGISLMGLAAMQWVLASSDRYIIGLFRSSEELGIYSLSYSLATNIFNILTTFLLLSAYPKIIKAFNNNGKKGASESIGIHLRYYFIIIMPVFWGVTSLSTDLIKCFSSSEYLDGVRTFVITSLSMLVYGLTFYYNKTWELTKNTKVILFHSLCAGILNILLNFLLVPLYGYEGAAYTTLIAYVLYFAITVYRSKQHMDIKMNVKSVCKIFIASVIMYVSVKKYTDIVDENIVSLILASILGMVIYIILLWILNEIPEELKLVKSKLSRAKYKLRGNE